MRVNNINLGTLGRAAQAFPAFGAKEVYDWEKDADFLALKEAGDEFVASSDLKAPEEEPFDDGIQRIFEKRDAENGEPSFVFKIGGNKNNGVSFVVKTACLVTALCLAGTFALSRVPFIGDAMRDAAKQSELEDKFKNDPEAVAYELIASTGLDKAAVNDFLNPFSGASFSSVISGKADEELLGDLPLGPDSRLGYSIEDFITTPDTLYTAALDIDGDDHPEISLIAGWDGYVDIFYDYNSDGRIDSHSVYDPVFGAAGDEKKSTFGAEAFEKISAKIG